MKLSIGERVNLINILPQESTIISMRIVRDLQTELLPSNEEIKELEIKEVIFPNGSRGMNWNIEKAKACLKEISISENALSIIKERLRKLDTEKKISVNLISLYDKFVDGCKSK